MQLRKDDLDCLGHALTDFADLLVPPAVHLEAVKPIAQPLARFFFIKSTQLSEIQGLLPDPHRLVQTAFFRQVANARQMGPRQGFAKKGDGAGIRRSDAIEHPQQSGFACAVGAKQAEDAGLWDFEAYTGQCTLLAKSLFNS